MNTRTGSIAKRLNAALVRRKFLRALLVDIIVALVVIATWCVTIEGTHGGHITNVTERYFTGYEIGSVSEIVTEVREQSMAGLKWIEKRITETKQPNDGDWADQVTVRGAMYRFTIGGETYSEDATVILSMVPAVTVILMLLQLVDFVIQHFTGRGLIKRYLRPIDDIALTAERISSTQKTSSSAEVASLAHEINKIDDSDMRVAVHDSELGGLEAAVNNMLKRLEESKRKSIRFVDDASHELRTPIAVLLGYVNMLDRWGKDDPKVMEESIAAIKNEAEHMQELIDQLLFLARGDMERHVIHRMPLDTNELLEEVAEESRMIDPAHEYLFETDGAAHPINADPAMMKQVLRILTDNARKYTPDGGTIKFRAYERGGDVCMEVSDTGIGIPNDELPRIFDRFYRGQNLRGDSNSGSGLGLSIAKWIVDEHGGKIEAMSSEGIGTRMTTALRRYND